MSRDQLTIVIPTRDRPRLLAECLASIFEAQPVVPRVLVSDNSTSDHPEMAELRARYGFTYIRQSGRLGLVEHQNRCFELATSRWMLMLHDDDTLYSGVLARLQDFLTTCEDVGIICGGVQTFGAEGRVLDQWIPKVGKYPPGEEALLAVSLDWGHRAPGLIYRVDALRELGGFETVDGLNADYAHVLTYAFRRGVAFFPELLGRYRFGVHGQVTQVGTLPDAVKWLIFTAGQVELLRKLPCSAGLVDRILDYMVWSVFWLGIAPQWRERRPQNVFRLARTCLTLAPRRGEWQSRIRREAPYLFWQPWQLACAALVMRRKIRSALAKVRRSVVPA